MILSLFLWRVCPKPNPDPHSLKYWYYIYITGKLKILTPVLWTTHCPLPPYVDYPIDNPYFSRLKLLLDWKGNKKHSCMHYHLCLLSWLIPVLWLTSLLFWSHSLNRGGRQQTFMHARRRSKSCAPAKKQWVKKKKQPPPITFLMDHLFPTKKLQEFVNSQAIPDHYCYQKAALYTCTAKLITATCIYSTCTFVRSLCDQLYTVVNKTHFKHPQ